MMINFGAPAPMNGETRLFCCLNCRSTQVVEVVRPRVFKPRGAEVRVDLLRSRCEQCGCETTRASQHAMNLARLAARKAEYGNVLMGEQILGFRKRYGLTQKAASRMFGKGLIAFSRYENETSYPDATTTKLLRLAIDDMQVAKRLADIEGVVIPLWAERVEDEQRLSMNRSPNSAPEKNPARAA